MRHDFGFNPAVPEWRTDDADLAMALELADVIMREQLPNRGPCEHGASCEVCVPHWLRTEVRNALLERAQ
jgi:hypothetical protein